MKTLNLLLVTFLLSSIVKLNAESTLPVSLNAADWTETGFTLGIIASNVNDALVIELPENAEGDPWQAIAIPLTAIDLSTYPVLRIKLTGTAGVAWNIKASPLTALDPQFEIVGGDQTTFGTFEFNVVEKTGFSGSIDFNLFVWIIGKGKQLNIEELYFYNPLTVAISGEKMHSIALTSRDSGITLENVQGQAVAVFSVDGKMLRQTFAPQSRLDIDLKKGVYIIKVGGTTLKVAI